VSAAALSGLEPIAAAAAGSGEPIAATTAGERVQQLQALLAQVEHGPTIPTFASALDAAQAGGASSATADAYTSSAPIADAATADSDIYPASTPGAAYTPMLPANGYASAIPTADGYTTALPTAVAYDSAAPAGAGAAGGGSAYAPLIEQAAARYGLDPSLLYGLIQQESGFDPSASSSAGALGLTQLMPSTAASLGVAEPLDPAQSIEGGARYLSQLLHQFAGNTADALAAYNAGPGAVEQYGGVPPYPETQQYVAKVLGYAASYSQSGQDTGTAALPTTTAPITAGAAAAEAIV
jgi:soluble lytic murein transglycosylase-like protein